MPLGYFRSNYNGLHPAAELYLSFLRHKKYRVFSLQRHKKCHQHLVQYLGGQSNSAILQILRKDIEAVLCKASIPLI